MWDLAALDKTVWVSGEKQRCRYSLCKNIQDPSIKTGSESFLRKILQEAMCFKQHSICFPLKAVQHPQTPGWQVITLCHLTSWRKRGRRKPSGRKWCFIKGHPLWNTDNYRRSSKKHSFKYEPLNSRVTRSDKECMWFLMLTLWLYFKDRKQSFQNGLITTPRMNRTFVFMHLLLKT